MVKPKTDGKIPPKTMTRLRELTRELVKAHRKPFVPLSEGPCDAAYFEGLPKEEEILASLIEAETQDIEQLLKELEANMDLAELLTPSVYLLWTNAPNDDGDYADRLVSVHLDEKRRRAARAELHYREPDRFGADPEVPIDGPGNLGGPSYQAKLRAIQAGARVAGRTKCSSCGHPEHWGLCSARSGGTAYRCMCSRQPPIPVPDGGLLGGGPSVVSATSLSSSAKPLTCVTRSKRARHMQLGK